MKQKLYQIVEPVLFWPSFIAVVGWHKVTGRHTWITYNVTDGNVWVVCRGCGDNREPTAAELRDNEWRRKTTEERHQQQAREEAIERALKDQGYI